MNVLANRSSQAPKKFGVPRERPSMPVADGGAWLGATALPPSPVAAVVLDEMCLRDAALVSGCIDRFKGMGHSIVVPQAAIFEMLKNPASARSTAERSLSHIARCPDAVVVARTIADSCAHELAFCAPMRDMADRAVTDWLRGILRDLVDPSAGGIDRLLADTNRTWTAAFRKAHSSFQVAEMRKVASQVSRTYALRNAPRIIAELGAGDRARFRDLLRREVLRFDNRAKLANRLRQQGWGFASIRARALFAAPSVNVLSQVGAATRAILWQIRGGLQPQVKPDTVANDVLDLEYQVAALWAGHLVTNDKDSRASFDELRLLGGDLWPDEIGRFQSARAFTSAEYVRFLNDGHMPANG